MSNAAEYVASLVERAKKAQAIAEGFTQERVDELCAAIAYNASKPEFAKKAGDMLVEESKLGHAPDKYNKMYAKAKGTWRDMKDKKSVGVIERDEEKGLIKLAKPVGVIAAICPVTNGEATPICKAMSAIKGRNAIILAPHPSCKKTNMMVTDYIRATLKKYGAPEDLVIAVDPDQVSIECSGELMKQADMVLATGGSGLVKAAYASGTPTIGVGTGNASMIVDGSTDLDAAANMIMRSKTFDNATSCSTENNLIINEEVYDNFVKALQKQGGYLIKNGSKEKDILREAVWPDGHTLSRKIVAKPIETIAEVASLKLPEGTKFIMVEEDGIGPDHLFSGEKLSVITTLHKYNGFKDALNKLEAILSFMGQGHSCGIHTNDDAKVLEMSEKMKVARIMVNQPQCLANSGAWTNGMPYTMTLGCGTWGGNSTTRNVTWEDLLNITWVSYPIPNTQPTDEELFPASVIAFNK